MHIVSQLPCMYAHHTAVTLCAHVASPWCVHPYAHHVAIAQCVHASIMLLTLCCMRAQLVLGCGACTQDLQQEKEKTTYQVVLLWPCLHPLCGYHTVCPYVPCITDALYVHLKCVAYIESSQYEKKLTYSTGGRCGRV